MMTSLISPHGVGSQTDHGEGQGPEDDLLRGAEECRPPPQLVDITDQASLKQ
jgi:hypothetical protein